ncbi:hypothetical protein GCM10023322_10270 [Rugosimonospora acidiphila]|uniref:F5/8 type C domain-containing protein n=2 Tax=Rugosimonospora acidiphila TaxID=556531 RepID=A0ABP9RMJ7_9ACTN
MVICWERQWSIDTGAVTEPLECGWSTASTWWLEIRDAPEPTPVRLVVEASPHGRSWHPVTEYEQPIQAGQLILLDQVPAHPYLRIRCASGVPGASGTVFVSFAPVAQ